MTSDLHTQLRRYPHAHVQTYEHTQMNIMADVWDAIQIPDRKAHRNGMDRTLARASWWGQPVRSAPRKGGSSYGHGSHAWGSTAYLEDCTMVLHL